MPNPAPGLLTPPDLDSAALHADAVALNEAVSALVRIYQFRDRDKICCYDVSVTQCHALEVLAEQGPQRSQALSAALRLDKSTTTRVVDALVRKGYVERLPDPDDGRAVSLSITASGRELVDCIRRSLVAQQVDLLRGLEPAVRSATIEVIQRLANRAATRFVDADARVADARIADARIAGARIADARVADARVADSPSCPGCCA